MKNIEDIFELEKKIGKLVKEAIIEGLNDHSNLNKEDERDMISTYVGKKLSYMKDEGFFNLENETN